MKLSILMISFLFILIMFYSCATNRKTIPQNSEVNGIIYFEKDEPGIKKKSKKSAKQNNSKTLNKKEQPDPDNIRDFKKITGSYILIQMSKQMRNPVNH